MKQILLIAGLSTMMLIGTSCSNNKGQIMWQDVGDCMGGDVTGGGTGANMSEERTWNNPSNIAEVNFDITASKNAINKDSGDDSFSGTSQSGTPGEWTIKVTLKKFKGDGSFSVCPVN